jgi:hypothetical protein
MAVLCFISPLIYLKETVSRGEPGHRDDYCYSRVAPSFVCRILPDSKIEEFSLEFARFHREKKLSAKFEREERGNSFFEVKFLRMFYF